MWFHSFCYYKVFNAQRGGYYYLEPERILFFLVSLLRFVVYFRVPILFSAAVILVSLTDKFTVIYFSAFVIRIYIIKTESCLKRHSYQLRGMCGYHSRVEIRKATIKYGLLNFTIWMRESILHDMPWGYYFSTCLLHHFHSPRTTPLISACSAQPYPPITTKISELRLAGFSRQPFHILNSYSGGVLCEVASVGLKFTMKDS